MQHESTGKRPPGGGLSHSAVDALAAAAVFCIGLVMMFDNHRIGSGWGADGPQPGYFPFYIGAILCIAAVVVGFRSLFGRQRDRTIFVSWERFRLVLVVLVPTALFILATAFVGIYVASTVFIAIFMRVLGKTSWLQTALVSLGVSAVLFWMFEIQFMVPLPKGPLESWLGY